MVEIVDKKSELEGLSNVNTKLEELSLDCLHNETDNTEGLEERSRVIILRAKKTQDGKNKPVRVVLERPSERMSQHLKPLYINAYFEGLLVDRVLIDGGSAVNIMSQVMLRVL